MYSVARCCRECELHEARTAGQTGSLTNYNLLASELPQHLRLAVYQQEEEPEGWREGGHGPWPEGGFTVVKGRAPPSWKTWRTGVNWKCGENLHQHAPAPALSPSPAPNSEPFVAVTTGWARGANPHNHLHQGQGLERLVFHHCGCKSGKRTNAGCSHITALVKALCCPGAFRSTKKMTARQYDINVPDAHQPVSGGTPAVVVTPQQAVTPCLRPPRATRDTRVNSRDFYCLGLQNLQLTVPLDPRAGYSAQHRVPAVGRGQVQQGRQRGRGGRGARGRGGGRGGRNGHPSGLGLFTNPGQDLPFLVSIFCSNSPGIVPDDVLL